ncbi:putative TolC family protein [Azospirillaceae bacterium]
MAALSEHIPSRCICFMRPTLSCKSTLVSSVVSGIVASIVVISAPLSSPASAATGQSASSARSESTDVASVKTNKKKKNASNRASPGSGSKTASPLGDAGALTPASSQPGAAPGAPAAPPETNIELPRIDFAELLNEARRAGRIPEGARSRMAGLAARSVSLNEIGNALLERNHDIRSAAESVETSKAVITQTDAAFDPSFFSSLYYNWADSFSRREIMNMLVEQSPDDVRTQRLQQLNEQTQSQAEQMRQNGASEDEVNSFLSSETGTNSGTPVCGIQVDGAAAIQVTAIDPKNANLADVQTCFLPPVMQTVNAPASYPMLATHTVSNSLGLGWKSGFGAQISLSLSTTYRKKSSFQTPSTPGGTFAYSYASDPFGWGGPGLYWTSSAQLSLSMPFPYTKGFGYSGSQESFNLRLAESGQRRSVWAEKSTRNSVLAQGLSAYWDMVSNAESLKSLVAHRRLLEERLSRQKGLFALGLATQYDVSQLEVAIANQESREEIAWNQYLTISNRLQALMAEEQRGVFIPKDIDALLEQRVPLNADAVYQRALDTHPDLKTQREALEAGNMTVQFRENQNRPDISFSVIAGVGQSDSAFGYGSPWAAWSNLGSPDNSNIYVGVRYRLPLGKNQTEAALRRARIEEKQAYDRSRMVQQQIVNTVDRALGDLRSAESVVRQSDEDFKLAKTALERSMDLSREGLVSEFEVINRHDELLTARLNWISAQIGYRKSVVRMLAAQGVLEQEYMR